MTKKEIVRTISENCDWDHDQRRRLTQLQVKEIVQKTFDAIVDTLVKDGRIELRNFGVFAVKERAARKARNPRTGEKVFVDEKFVVTFKPGKEMEEKMLHLSEKAKRQARRDPPAKSRKAVGAGEDEENRSSSTPPPSTQPT